MTGIVFASVPEVRRYRYAAPVGWVAWWEYRGIVLAFERADGTLLFME